MEFHLEKCFLPADSIAESSVSSFTLVMEAIGTCYFHGHEAITAIFSHKMNFLMRSKTEWIAMRLSKAFCSPRLVLHLIKTFILWPD